MLASGLPSDIATPAYVLDAAKLAANMATADRIRREAGCKMLLATKAWAMPAAFPLMRDHLDGTTASGEYEARLGREEFGKEVHTYAPAYAPGEVARLMELSDHIYFNSPEQLTRHLDVLATASTPAIPMPRSAGRCTIRARPTRASAPRATSSMQCRGSTCTRCMRTRCANRCTTARSASSST